MFTNCKHRKGVVCGLCFDCSTPIHIKQLKFSNELKRMIGKDNKLKILLESDKIGSL